ETPKQVDTPKQVETPKQDETPKQVDTPKQVETPKQDEQPSTKTMLPTMTEPDEVITPTPTPTPINPNNKDDKKPITKYTTFTTTFTTVIPGTTKFVTTTNDQGEPTTLASYIPPSTVVVVKKVTSPMTEPSDIAQDYGNSNSIILNGSHGIWSIAISLIIGTSSFIFITLV
ncbi:2204_t:CDS:2, partial [Funneliformis geosporum]